MPGMVKDDPCSDPTCPICKIFKKEENVSKKIGDIEDTLAPSEVPLSMQQWLEDRGFKNAATPEPKPQTNSNPHVADVVAADILARGLPIGMAFDVMARKAAGMAKYGTALQPCNGRNNVNDLYQELVDAVKYAKTQQLQAIITHNHVGLQEIERIYDDLMDITERVYNLLHDGDNNGA